MFGEPAAGSLEQRVDRYLQPYLDIGHLSGTGPFVPHIGPRERTVEWTVRGRLGGGMPSVRVVASSAKAGR